VDDGLIATVKILAFMALFLGLTAYNTLYERRVVAPIQQRIGPNRAGPNGCCSRSPTR